MACAGKPACPGMTRRTKIETIIPGKQSVKFPGAPSGYVVAGDPGVPRTLPPTTWHKLLAPSRPGYSRNPPRAFSANCSVGLEKPAFYWRRHELHLGGRSLAIRVGDPPYGLYYGSAAPRCSIALLTRSSGASVGQRFSFVFPPTNVSPKNPDTNFPLAASCASLLRLLLRLPKQNCRIPSIRIHPNAKLGRTR